MNYLQRQANNEKSEMCDDYAKQILTPEQQASMKELSLFYVLGKRDRVCPILLTENTRAALNVLIARRKDVGINNYEVLLFP